MGNEAPARAERFAHASMTFPRACGTFPRASMTLARVCGTPPLRGYAVRTRVNAAPPARRCPPRAPRRVVHSPRHRVHTRETPRPHTAARSFTKTKFPINNFNFGPRRRLDRRVHIPAGSSEDCSGIAVATPTSPDWSRAGAKRRSGSTKSPLPEGTLAGFAAKPNMWRHTRASGQSFSITCH